SQVSRSLPKRSISTHESEPAIVPQSATTTNSNKSCARVRSMRGSVRFSNGVKTDTSLEDMEKPSVNLVLHEGIQARPLPQTSPLQYCRRIRCDGRGSCWR